jgi:hypothetical protein
MIDSACNDGKQQPRPEAEFFAPQQIIACFHLPVVPVEIEQPTRQYSENDVACNADFVW